MTARARTRHLVATGLTVALTGGGLAATAAPAQAAPAAVDGRVAAIGSSTALMVSDMKVEFGARVTVTAKVATTSGTAAGTVAFRVDGASTTVALTNGVASLEVKGSVVGINTVGATFTPSDPAAYDGSAAAPSQFTVVKATTTTSVKIVGKRAGTPTIATAKAIGFHRTLPNGKVKLILRKRGEAGIQESRRGKLGKGSRGFNLGRLDRGTYQVTVKFLGDPSHRRSQVIKTFRIRP